MKVATRVKLSFGKKEREREREWLNKVPKYSEVKIEKYNHKEAIRV